MILTYKYRLKDRSAKKLLRRHAFAVNQVWNYCNGVQKDLEDRYRSGAPKRKWPSHYDLQALTKGTSKDLGIHAQSVQCVCQEYATRRDKTKGHLRFRVSQGVHRNLGWIPFQSQSRQVQGNSIVYLGHRFRWWGNQRRPLPENAKGGAFVEDTTGKWWVCFAVEVQSLPLGKGKVGVDLGLHAIAALSNGAVLNNPRTFRLWEERLAKAQRAHKPRRAAVIHQKIKNTRLDLLHKFSAQVAEENSFVAVGAVSPKAMSQTPFAKSAQDASWGLLKGLLRYKVSRHEGVFAEIDERFTTQTCSSCGAMPPERPRGIAGLGIREWKCSECGEDHDRDVNAARNILAVALSAQRLAEGSRLTCAATGGSCGR